MELKGSQLSYGAERTGQENPETQVNTLEQVGNQQVAKFLTFIIKLYCNTYCPPSICVYLLRNSHRGVRYTVIPPVHNHFMVYFIIFNSCVSPWLAYKLIANRDGILFTTLILVLRPRSELE